MKIPIKESTASLQPTMINPNTAATLGKEIVDVGEGLSGMADQIQKMNNKRQTFKAEAYLANAHNENWKMVSSSPDLDNLEENLDKQSTQQIQDAAALIKDANARNAFVEKATLDTDRRNIGLYHTIAQRQSKDYKNSMVMATDADIKELHSIADPEHQNLKRQQIVDRINSAKESGHVDPMFADHYLKTTLKDIDIQQVGHDIGLNAQSTLEELKKGSEGRYNYLSDEENQSFQKQAQQKVDRDLREQKQQIKRTWDKNDQELNQRRMTGSLTYQDVEEKIATGSISPSAGKSYMRNLRSPQVIGARTDPETYSNLISYVSDPNISNEKKTIALRDANSKGLLELDDEKDLYNMHLIFNQGKEESFKDKVGESEYKKGMGLNTSRVLTKIGDYFNIHFPINKESRASASKIFVQSLKKDMPPDSVPGLAYEAVKKQRLLDKPEMTSYPESGQGLMDEDGVTSVAYPDGRLQGDNEDQGSELPSGY